MGINNNPANSGQIVDDYINTAYDTVKVVADNLTEVVRVADLSTTFQASSTPPTTRADGNPLESGDRYFNESSTSIYTWDATGLVWIVEGSTNTTYEAVTVDVTMASTGTITLTNPYVVAGDNKIITVQGVIQYPGTDYTETDTTTLDFGAGVLVEGDTIFSIIGTSVAISTIDAAATTYTPDGGIATTVAAKLNEFTSIKDFSSTAGDGVTEATAATILAVANGGSVYFPDGTYIFHFSAVSKKIELLSNTNIILSPGAVIKVTANINGVPATIAEELSQYVFYADNKENISITGGQFNGNKNDTYDSSAGLVKFTGCQKCNVSKVDFYDSSKDTSGLIYYESYNGVSNEFTEFCFVYNNTFERCSWGVSFRNLWRNSGIINNSYKDGSLSNPNAGIPKYGSTVYPGRAFRLSGYINSESSSADGDIGGIVIQSNTVDNATYGIEVWNQDATVGRNPDNASRITITGNTVKALFGIGINSFSGSTISDNTLSYSQHTSAEITTYAGTASIVDTSSGGGNTAGTMIEARPGYGFTVSGNSINNVYTGTGTDYTASSAGISMGTNAKNVRCEATVKGNYITNCYHGFSIQDTQNSLIAENSIFNCRNAINNSAGTNSFGNSGNTLKNNKFLALGFSTVNSTIVSLVGDWTVSGNEFDGNASDTLSVPLLTLGDTTGVFKIKKNEFNNFIGEAVSDKALTSEYSGNEYDAGSGSGANGCIAFTRQDNKTVTIGQEHVVKATAAFGWRGVAGTGETYTAQSMLGSSVLTSFNKSVSSGTIYDLFAFCGYSNAAPVAGTKWAKGCIFYNNAPAAAGTIGWVCTLSGTPGTWKTFGDIAA